MCLYRISSVGSAMQWGDGFRDRFVCWLVTCPVSGGRGWDFWEGYNLHMALSYMEGGDGGLDWLIFAFAWFQYVLVLEKKCERNKTYRF